MLFLKYADLCALQYVISYNEYWTARVGTAELQKDVLLLEEQEGAVNFKMGVMFMKPGQKTDDEMLSNEFGNEKFERFIALLGDTVRLKSWNRFRGGLDVKGDMTGLYSVYTMHRGHEIMFHVSTMLPYSEDNKQQVGFLLLNVQ